MNDRLAALHFLPPPTGKLWTGRLETDPVQGSEIAQQAVQVRRSDDGLADLGIPLFWNTPPWHRVPAVVADLIAGVVADHGVVVSALLRELSEVSSPSTFHDADNTTTRLRMIPYRAERYGLSARDFDNASVVDLRLATPRDENGRFAYSPAQIQRWELTPDDAPLAGGSWVPAATFPPDVPSLDDLNAKIDQLHALAPRAAVMVSIYPHRMATELPMVLQQNPDGVILRCEGEGFDGLTIATITQRAKQTIVAAGSQIPLWVSAGEVTPAGAAKLVALGADAIAMDHWSNQLIYRAEATLAQAGASRLSYGGMQVLTPEVIQALADEEIVDEIAEFEGLCESVRAMPSGERLVTTDAAWAKTLNIPMTNWV